MRISDWSSDVCSSDLVYLIDEDGRVLQEGDRTDFANLLLLVGAGASDKAHDLVAMLHADPVLASHVVAAVRLRQRRWDIQFDNGVVARLPEENPQAARSEEHTSELPSLMRTSYA